MSVKGRDLGKRRYRPAVEALEALRLLDAAPSALPGLIAHFDILRATPAPLVSPGHSDAAWDLALDQTGRLADWLSTPTTQKAPSSADVASGLNQLDKYLTSTWYRAGIAPQAHDDCTQAVYMSLLQNLGRTKFDHLVGEIGQSGIPQVLSRETTEGPDFFRAIDAVKKRAQRERSFQPIDHYDLAAGDDGVDAAASWRGALREAMSKSLNARETDLIDATLKGETPAEIAIRWGVAPKTVSNEKSRAIQKLRDTLTAELDA